MAASQRQLQRSTHFRNSYIYFTFLTLTSGERGTKTFFFSKGFEAKCKHIELALNFIQKQYFS